MCTSLVSVGSLTIVFRSFVILGMYALRLRVPINEEIGSERALFCCKTYRKRLEREGSEGKARDVVQCFSLSDFLMQELG